MPLVARLSAAVISVIFLTGCINETLLDRTVLVQPDGSGLLVITMAYSSDKPEDVTEKLAQISSGEEHNQMLTLGFLSVENDLVEQTTTSAVVRTTAVFNDWSVLAQWFFGGSLDLERQAVIRSTDSAVLFDTFIPPGDEDIESIEDQVFLTVAVDCGSIVDSNADITEVTDQKLSWTLRQVATDGVYFWVDLADGK